MVSYWRAIVAAAVLGGSGCCHNCGCCDTWNARDDRPPMRLDEGPPPLPVQQRPAGALPPAGPQPGTGAYGGT